MFESFSGSSASVHYLLGLKLLLHSQHAQRQSFWAPLFGSSARCALSPPGAGAGAVVLATLRVREVMEAPVVPEALIDGPFLQFFLTVFISTLPIQCERRVSNIKSSRGVT